MRHGTRNEGARASAYLSVVLEKPNRLPELSVSARAVRRQPGAKPWKHARYEVALGHLHHRHLVRAKTSACVYECTCQGIARAPHGTDVGKEGHGREGERACCVVLGRSATRKPCKQGRIVERM